MPSSRFTFCIPNLNKIGFLPACIESILAQGRDDCCCIVCGWVLTDGCWEYTQRLAGDPRFWLGPGMHADWNEFLRHVKTQVFLTFLTHSNIRSYA
jgi:hypothetical protein